MSKRILETYLENLDYNKLFFTQEDVDQFTQKYGTSLGDSILLGDLQPAKEIYAVFQGAGGRSDRENPPAPEKGLHFQEQQNGCPGPAKRAVAGQYCGGRCSFGEIESRGNCSRKNSINLRLIPDPRWWLEDTISFSKSVEERDDEDLVQVFLNCRCAIVRSPLRISWTFRSREFRDQYAALFDRNRR